MDIIFLPDWDINKTYAIDEIAKEWSKLQYRSWPLLSSIGHEEATRIAHNACNSGMLKLDCNSVANIKRAQEFLFSDGLNGIHESEFSAWLEIDDALSEYVSLDALIKRAVIISRKSGHTLPLPYESWSLLWSDKCYFMLEKGVIFLSDPSTGLYVTFDSYVKSNDRGRYVLDVTYQRLNKKMLKRAEGFFRQYYANKV